MKTSKNKFMMALATFACALLIAIMPMFAVVTHAGDSATTTTSVANVTATGVDVSAQDAELESVSYSIDVMLTDAYVSSFEMSIRMPNFVDVTAVQESATLARMDKNGVFEYNVDNRGYVNVAYSSSVDFSGITLFTVVFTVNDYTEQYEVIECASCQFVNSAVQEVYANVDLGYISIGSTEIIVMGDVNGDNTVNLADLLIIQRSIVNPDYALTEEQLTVADIDKNGEINIIDCQYIQNYLVGKIDSLENVGASTYTVGVMINDQNGNMLYKGSFVAQSGVPYAEYMTPIFMELSKTYNITGNLSISSKVYGTIDPESSGEGFVIKGDDEIVMVVNVEENSGEEKKIVYSYSFSESYTDGTNAYINMELYADGTMKASNILYDTDGNELNNETVFATWVQKGDLIDVTIEGATQTLFQVQEDGSIVPYMPEEDKAIVYTYHFAFATESGAKVEFDYTFYNDGTVLGVEFENGVNTGEYWANWAQDGQYIDITFEGETERMFVVNEDGSLSMYDGGGSDVEEPVKIMDYNLSMHELSVACGTSQGALLKELTSAYLTLYYSNGTSEQVAITADMLDISNVVLDVDGTYRVLVSYYNEEMGFGAEMEIRVTVLPDTSDWEYLDTYTFVCDGENMFGWETFDFYTEAIAINGVDGVEYCQWTTTEDGVVEMVYDDVAVLMQLNVDEKTISFYQPSADTLIGAYTFTEGDMQMVFSVYGQYGGVKDYVACVTQTMIGDAGAILRVNITVYVQLDLENSILHPYMIGREFTINEDNTLTMKECEHEWVTETQAPTCTQEGYERRWCSKCGEGMGTIIEKLDHSYDENGICANCGAIAGENDGTDTEVEAYRTTRMEEVLNAWQETVNKYADYDVEGAYGANFENIYKTISTAENVSVVDRYCEIFYQMIEEIHSNYSSEDSIVSAYTDAILAEVTVGASIEDYIAEEVVGKNAYVEYSQSGLRTFTITEDMIFGIDNLDFSVCGTQTYYIRCESVNIPMNVTVKPNMDGATELGCYIVSSDIISMPWTDITFYDNGYALVSTGESCKYSVENGVYTIIYAMYTGEMVLDNTLLMVVDEENKIISYYQPTEPVVGVYTFTDGIYMTLTLYGEDVGSGEYITVIYQEMTSDDGSKMTNSVTTVATLDIDNSTIWCSAFGRTLVYDEKNNLTWEGGSGSGDVVVDDYVNRISWGVDAIGIPVGSDPSVLMEKVVGTTFEVTYSQSGTVSYTVSEDMVNYDEVVFDTEGEYRVRVSFTAKDGGEYEYRFTVIITPDMSDVEIVGTYKVNVPEDYEMGFNEITLYANNIAFMDGGYYVDVPTDYYVYKENVVAVNMDGGYLVFVLENGVANFYDPATELETIGTYVISSDYMSLTLIVYGEYTGAGDYVSTMIVTQQIDEKGNTMTMTVATIAYLDMENTALSHVMFGNMKYDEKGNLYCPHEETAVDSWEGDCWSNGYRREYCTNCGKEISYETIPTTGHDYDENGVCTRCGNGGSIEETFDSSEFFAMMDKEWSNLESQYNISEVYYARYNDLKIRLKESTSYDEAKMIYTEEFKMLCYEVEMNCGNAGDGVYLKDWQLVPSTVHVLAGTSVDEFATYFTQTYYVELYFSDGTREQAPILPEMMHLSELNLNSVGRAELIIDFSYGEHSIGFNLSIYVDPDMTNATASGSFNYVDKVVNGMEWDTITLYDNGYAILYCNGDVDEYVEYTLEDGILTYTTYGERMVYMIVDGGVYCYTSEQVIGTYYENDEGFSITIYGEYTGYGEYYAKFDVIEESDEGMAECFSASTVVILDMENCEIYCGMIGGWMVYDENGNVSPKSESEGEGEEAQKPSTDSDYIYDANGSVSVIA